MARGAAFVMLAAFSAFASQPVTTIATGRAPVTPAAIEAASQSAPASASCAGVAFDVFLARFVDDAAAQTAAIADPLEMQRIDTDAQPEPARVLTRIPRSDVGFPLIPGHSARESGGLELIVEPAPVDADTRRVVLRVPDTGDQRAYHFRRAPCWTLVRVSDEAI